MDELSELVERIDNLIVAMTLPVPAEIHLSALRESLPEIRDELRSVYFKMGGTDHWNE